MGLVFSHPLDNLLRTASSIILETGTLVSAARGTANLFNNDVSASLMITGTEIDLRFGWDDPVLPEFPSILHSTLDVAAAFESDTSNDFSTPEGEYAFGVPSTSQYGFFSAPFLDLRGETPRAWWRLHLTGNTRAITLGELWLGSTYRTLAARNFKYAGFRPDAQGATNVIETNADVQLSYTRAPRRDSWTGVVMANAPDQALIETWLDAARFRARPFVFVPDDTVDRAYWAKFDSDASPRGPHGPALADYALTIRQQSYGLPWINPDA